MFLLRALWSGLKWLGGAIVAPLAKLRNVRGIGRIVRCVVHALAMLLVVALLLWVNDFFRLDTVLRTPAPLLRMVWLPLLFLLVYALCWLGWYVCRYIAADEEPSPFPDIDKAWRQAMTALSQAGVDVVATPLYLLVGRPRGPMHDLIRAAGVPLAIAPTPNDDEAAPLQVFANREAIYVSCADVSLLGRQAELFAQLGRHDAADQNYATRDVEDADVELDEIPLDHGDNGHPSAGIATATLPASAAATHKSLAAVEGHVAMLVDFELDAEATADLDPVVADLSTVLLKDIADVELITARLRHLCRLIVEERRPNVPVHGVLLLAPAAAADCDEAANHVGVLGGRDLQTIGEMTQVRCPHVMLVCDLETTQGGIELLSRFPAEQRARRLGVRLPEFALCDAAAAGEAIDEGVRWLCEALLPPLVYRLVRSPQSQCNDVAEVLHSNVALYQFLYRMRQRRPRLSRIIRRVVTGRGEKAESLAGCYLVASGTDNQREQGFAEAVFAQLPQLSSSLAWTDEILRLDRRHGLLAKMGYVGLVALGAALVVVAILL